MISKEELLKKYNISEAEFVAADISWEALEYIYNDFSSKRDYYQEKLIRFEKEYLLNIEGAGIHSYRTRVKDSEHLIVKIIRKKQENYRKYKNLDQSNYEKFLTDLAGIRCFILFKEDWRRFHNYIERNIEDNPARYVKDSIRDFDEDIGRVYMAEEPKAHIRAGDSKEIYEDILRPDAIKSSKIYRSVHYIVKYHEIYVEIQVRTLFEEGWGEVDHFMVYPYYQNDKLFQQYTGLLNRLTGLADEMSSFFSEVKRLEVDFIEHNKKDIVGAEGNAKKTDVCPKEKEIEDTEIIEGETPKECIKHILQE